MKEYRETLPLLYDKTVQSGYYDYDSAVETLDSVLQDGEILEVGIGTGNLALPLHHRGYHVAGVDTSEPMLRRLRDRPGDIDVQHVSVSEMSWHRRFDAVVSHGGPLIVTRHSGRYFLDVNTDATLDDLLGNITEQVKDGGTLFVNVEEDLMRDMVLETDDFVYERTILSYDNPVRRLHSWDGVSLHVTTEQVPLREALTMLERHGFAKEARQEFLQLIYTSTTT